MENEIVDTQVYLMKKANGFLDNIQAIKRMFGEIDHRYVLEMEKKLMAEYESVMQQLKIIIV